MCVRIVPVPLDFEMCPACKHQLHHASAAAAPKSATATGIDSAASTPPPPASVGTVHFDLLEQKRIADAVDKMCPMCAKLYSSTTTFDTFKEHVESHFVDDTEIDNGLDNNFELVSHTVGDF